MATKMNDGPLEEFLKCTFLWEVYVALYNPELVWVANLNNTILHFRFSLKETQFHVIPLLLLWPKSDISK